jgi:p-methyltransferase
MDFTLRLKRNKRDLTLAAFYEWASEGFRAENVSRGEDYGEDIPAAGFYLQGLLHMHGYETVLTNKYDVQTLKDLADKDLFAVCVSSTMIITSASFLDLLSSIRLAIPGVPVIAGGVSIWKNYFQFERHLAQPEDYPLHPEMLFHPSHMDMDADVLIVAQHGISSFLEVLKELEKGSKARFDHIPNLCLPGKNGFVFTKTLSENVDYDTDITRWDLIDNIPERIPVRTSIGCPYRCRFCDFCHLFPKIFLRSAQSLKNELDLIKAGLGRRPGFLHVTDDNVFVNKKRLFEVCGIISGSGLNHWTGFMRGGEYSDDEMKAIIDSGLMLGKMGVESGDQGQLDRMNKRQQADKVKRGIEQFDANGISILATFVVGFPGETQESLRNTTDFLNQLSLPNLGVSYQVYPLLIFDLSELADPSTRKKWQIDGFMDKWSHYTMKSDEALAACYQVFKDVSEVTYSYSEESQLFNRGMFDYQTRKSLYQLRQQLTIKLIEKAPWPEVEPILRKMAELMELTPDGLKPEILQVIEVPQIETGNWKLETRN